MEVGPSSDDDYLSVAWVVQVRCQLPLSRSIPAHVEAYLDNDEYNDNSGDERGEGGVMRHTLHISFKLFYPIITS